MARTYTLKRRAESQAQTRQRIIEAAVDLHCSVGPAAATLSMIAEKAGVQRHTLYAHFPDERSLFLACSGFAIERDAPPNAARWRDIAGRSERLRTGLTAIYGWFERNEGQAACVLRDAEIHPLTLEISQMRLGPYFAAWREVLGARLTAKQRAMLDLALSFYTWRTLVRAGGMKKAAAVDSMIRLIEGAKDN